MCDRTGEVFSFAHKTDGAHHEVLLPKGASEAFRDSIVLWNAAESAERRKDSQVCKELVLALPDDKGITLEDRIELSRRFVKEHFVEKGVAAQIDTHWPHESNYRWLYRPNQKKEKLYKLLVQKHGRRGRRKRVHHSKVKDRVSIHDRSEHVLGRKEIGHWEADLVSFKPF